MSVVCETQIGDLAAILQAKSPDGGQPITGISIDSRTVQPGDLFVAIRGERFDGHDYVAQAFQQGAAAALVDQPLRNEERPCLLVKDTLLALGQWARHVRQQTGYRVVGITGSVGKTTTRHMIAHVVGQQHASWQAPKNFNNAIGLPLTLLTAPTGTAVVVAELGCNRPGEIAYLADIAQPDIAVVTHIAPAHLEGFGTVAAIAEEKLSIASGLRQQGTLVLGVDSPPLRKAAQTEARQNTVTFGLSEEATIRANHIRYQPTGSTFTLENTPIALPLPGPGNVRNALACWGVCQALGMALTDFQSAIATLAPVAMRLESLQLGTLTVLSDCYNANPASMANALEAVQHIDPSGARRRVFVCGDMAELGPTAEAIHADLGTAIADAGIDLVIAVGPLAAVAANAAQAQAPDPIATVCLPDVHKTCQELASRVKDGDIVLVKGSRSARLELAVGKLEEHFSNRDARVAGR